jgi:hypothetical protein
MSEAPRHALVRCEPGGLLLDLRSGDLFLLNGTATFIWENALRGADPAAVAATLAARYDLAPATARDDVEQALTLDAAAAEAPLPPPVFRYQRSPEGDGYVFSRGEIPVLDIDATGSTLALRRPAEASRDELFGVLQALAPKLLALRGHFVLHASAAALAGGVVGFCGASGAGKTTTVRALVRAGAEPVAEDKLVLRSDSGRIEVVARGEPWLLAWAASAAAALASGGAASCDDLDRLRTADALPLRELGFIDAAGRAGDRMAAVPLTPLEAASAVFRNAFYGSDAPEDWTGKLETAAAVARKLPAYALSMPDGLASLDAAATGLARSGSIR